MRSVAHLDHVESNNSKPKQNMSTITIQLPTEPSYWGSTATEADVYRIIGNLEMMIRSQFPDVDIDFQHMQEPRGRGIFGNDESMMDSIYQFIQDNWTAAL
jgi:hypothetical protein